MTFQLSHSWKQLCWLEMQGASGKDQGMDKWVGRGIHSLFCSYLNRGGRTASWFLIADTQTSWYKKGTHIFKGEKLDFRG